MRSVLTGALAGALLIMTAGCAEPTTMAAGASLSALEYGVTTWSRRSLEAAELAPFDQTRDAVHRTLTDLDFEKVARRENPNGLWARVWTSDKQGRDVTITVLAVSPDVTKMKIRVGLLGDQAVSVALHREIQKRINAARRAGPTDGAPHDAGPREPASP